MASKNKIVPIVLHRVVESVCVDFEDITVNSLKLILSKNPNSYITIDDLDNSSSDSSDFKYMITFDDGYISDYTIVYPILLTLGIRATFFINTSNIGKTGYLDWAMINEMQQKGNVFGSHGHNHLKMTELNLQESSFEFIKSKELFEFNTGREVRLFSFPYGCFNKDLVNLSKTFGFTNCFISKHGIVGSIGNLVPRNSINGSMSELVISRILNPSFLTISIWFLEDSIKKILKIVFGDKLYKILRKKFLDIL